MNQFYLEIKSEKAAEITYNHKDCLKTHSGLFSFNGENLCPIFNSMDFVIALNRKNKFFIRCLTSNIEEGALEVHFEKLSNENASNKILHGEIKKIFYLTNDSILNPIISVEKFVRLIFEEKPLYSQIVKKNKYRLL